MKAAKRYRSGRGRVANMRTHHADRAGAAVVEMGGATPPSGVDTVD